MSNSFDPDQAQRNVGPDLGPNCLPRLSADDTGRQRVKCIIFLKVWGIHSKNRVGSLDNLALEFSTRFITNRALQPQMMARGLKFWIQEEGILCYQGSENKGTNQMCGYQTSIFSFKKKADFLMTWLNSNKEVLQW